MCITYLEASVIARTLCIFLDRLPNGDEPTVA